MLIFSNIPGKNWLTCLFSSTFQVSPIIAICDHLFSITFQVRPQNDSLKILRPPIVAPSTGITDPPSPVPAEANGPALNPGSQKTYTCGSCLNNLDIHQNLINA